MGKYSNTGMPEVYFISENLGTLTNKSQIANCSAEIHFNGQVINCYATGKIQGNSSAWKPAKNYTITFYEDEEHSKKKKVDVGWGKQSKYCFKKNWIDSTHTRNVSGGKIGYDMVKSRPNSDFKNHLLTAPRYGLIDGFPCIMYINGEFHGLYTWNIPKDEWMFNMDKDNPNHYVLCGEYIDGGASGVNTNEFRSLWGGQLDGNWSIEVGEYSETLKTSLNNAIGHVMNSSDTEFKTKFTNYFDLYSVIDYYCFAQLCTHLDGLTKNMLLVTYDGVHWGTSLYDMDSIYGAYWDGHTFVSPTYRFHEDYGGGNSLLWLRMEKCFAQEIYNRYFELRKSALSLDNIYARVNEIYNAISPEVLAADWAKWPQIPCQKTNTIERFRTYMKERAVYVDNEIAKLISANPPIIANPPITEKPVTPVEPDIPSTTPTQSIGDFIGKTFTGTGMAMFSGTSNYHFTALVEADSDMKKGAVITREFTASNCVNVSSSMNMNGGSVFEDNTGLFNVGALDENVCSPSTTMYQSIVDGKFTIVSTARTFRKDVTSKYIKVPFLIKAHVPFSFKIEDVAVLVNNVRKKIVGVGGLYPEDTFILTNSADTSENPKEPTVPTNPDKDLNKGEVISMSYWNGKIANFLGDSQTETNVHKTKTYCEWVKEILGLSKINVDGISGTCITTGSKNDHKSAISGRYVNMSNNADLIVIQGGVNDEIFNKELGTFEANLVPNRDQLSETQLKEIDEDYLLTFYGSMEQLCNGLLTKYPGKTIIFITPTSHDDAGTKKSNTTGYTAYDFSEAMKRVCAKYSILVYDAYSNSGIYPANDENAEYYTTDRLHLNDRGHEHLGNELARFILSHTPILKDDVDIDTPIKPSNPGTPVTPSEPDTPSNPVTPSEPDTPIVSTGFVGRTFNITGSKSPQMFHFTVVIKANELMKKNTPILRSMVMSNVKNVDAANTVGGPVFEDNSGKVSNGSYVSECSPSTTFTQGIDKTGKFICEGTKRIFRHDVTTKYIKVPFVISGTAPMSFKIEELKVTIGGVEQEIIDIGGFYAEDTFTMSGQGTPVTPSNPGTPVTPSEPNTPVTPSKPDTPVTPSKPVTPTVSNGFVGRTFNIIGSRNSQIFHFTVLIKANELMKKNTPILRSMIMSNVKNVDSANTVGGSIFEDNSGKLTNGQYVCECSPSTTFTQGINKTGKFVCEGTKRVFRKDVTAEYIKVPFIISGSAPMSFKIEELKVIIGGVEQEIIDIGGFYSEDAFTMSSQGTTR